MRVVLRRWAKFNLVGVAGAAVQLGAVHLLSRWLAPHYLWASAVALEATLIHNFFWHVHFTWKRSAGGRERGTQLLRFHAANGGVSLVGNLMVMRWLVGQLHVPPVAANAIAIGVCSVANFWLSDLWAFGESTRGICLHELGD
jgi:putative flippase GtrA